MKMTRGEKSEKKRETNKKTKTQDKRLVQVKIQYIIPVIVKKGNSAQQGAGGGGKGAGSTVCKSPEIGRIMKKKCLTDVNDVDSMVLPTALNQSMSIIIIHFPSGGEVRQRSRFVTVPLLT